jgi:Arc/MetJ-type ribon-helix-helix transcriptional regulator
MKIITINVPERYLKAIEELSKRGKYPSRSEAVRVALEKLIKSDLEMYQDLGKLKGGEL